MDLLRLVEEISRLLLKNCLTIAVAESCTGGLISHLLTQIPGSSEYFILGTVTYHNRTKIDLLGVEESLIKARGAVDRGVAREMARGVRRLAKTNIGLSTTGIAGPTGGTPRKPVGTVCIGYSSQNNSCAVKILSRKEERGENKEFFALNALNFLKEKILEEYG